MRGPSLTVTSDFTEKFNEVVNKFKRDAVLVGIPASDAQRKPDETGKMPEINNAALLAIANFGSSANNIPAWPIMAIGIRNAQAGIIEALKKGASLALSHGISAISTYYNRAGIIASTSIKKVINAQEGVPKDRPTKGTLAARKAVGFSGEKYWLRTGQLRNSITYVVRGDA